MSNRKQSWASAHSPLWTSPIPRSLGSATQSEVSSIPSANRDRSLLGEEENYHNPPPDISAANDSKANSFLPRGKVMVQVTDILESYGTVASESDIPEVLLTVVKELERARRENNFKDLLLREYTDAVQRRFCLYGEPSPPSVADVTKRLRDGTTTDLAPPPAPIWLEEPLNELRRSVKESVQSCYGREVHLPLTLILPDALHTRANVAQLLQSCSEELDQLAREHREAKNLIMDKAKEMPIVREKVGSLSLGDALAELDSHLSLKEEHPAQLSSTDENKGSTFRSALQTIIDAVPVSLQIHFELQVAETPVLTRCRNLADLVRFLLSEYLSMERYMEGVEQQRQRLAEVFRLPLSTLEDTDADEMAQIGDALSHSLALLAKTVSAVVTFPHQISEDEMALRRTSAEAVEELAQLFVDSRRGGSVSSSTSGLNAVGAGGSTLLARVEPPTQDLLEMVEMVKSRIALLQSQQQRKELAGMQGRVGQAHMEEAMRMHGKQILLQLRELCTSPDDGSPSAESTEALAELLGSLDTERHLTPAKLDYFLADVLERLRLVKTRHQRALNAAASGKTRADAASHKYGAAQKKLHKVAALVEQIGREGLGVTFPVRLGEEEVERRVEGGGDGVSTMRRLNLRQSADDTARKASTSGTVAVPDASTPTAASAKAATTTAAVTEQNVLEALQLIRARVDACAELRESTKVQEELERLHAEEARWRMDTDAFREALAMLMHQLARNGQLVKQSLFLMGTDEASKDDLIEEVLLREQPADSAAAAAQSEYVEHTLAELLQKYTRWAQRLQQTTEDHLYTQRKIVKYFAAVRRFFASAKDRDAATAATPEDIPEDNLYDIDACLMRAADVILPALDAALRGVSSGPASFVPPSAAPASPLPSLPSSATPAAVPGPTGTTPTKAEAIAQLAKKSGAAAAGGVLPYDHRIARLYEMVSRLYTAVTALMQVHYMSIPAAARRRGSSGELELLFDGGDSAEDGFVDIDLDRLIRVSQNRSTADKSGDGGSGAGATEAERFHREGGDGTGGSSASPAANANTSSSSSALSPSPATSPAPPPASTVAANNDVILRVTYQNMEVLQDVLKRFSANHKMAAILLQKDVDTLQQLLASMLEKYSAVDMEAAFGQRRDALLALYTTLRDRAQVQKGCYFFNRAGGEGSGPWVTALEQLATGFHGIVDRLVTRTAQATAHRELTEEVVDLCASYVNWALHHPLPPALPVPPELLAMCVRDGKVLGGEGGRGEALPSTSTSPAPPPSATPPLPSMTAAMEGQEVAALSPASPMARPAQRPPKPSGTPSLTPRASITQQQQRHEEESASQATTSCADPTATLAVGDTAIAGFTEDRAVLKAISHMFQLAQLAAETSSSAATSEAAATQLSSDLTLLREAVAVAEQQIDTLTNAKQMAEQQRDQAQSEAAVARAELRRWRRQQRQREEEEGATAAHSVPQLPPAPTTTMALSAVEATPYAPGMDPATVQAMMFYMQALNTELHGTQSQEPPLPLPSFVRSPPSPGLDDFADDRGAGAHTDNEEEYRRYHDRHAPLQQQQQQQQQRRSNSRGARRPSSATTAVANRYAALADELRHQYGPAALAPMVVIDPHTQYSSPLASHSAASEAAAAASRSTPRISGVTPSRRRSSHAGGRPSASGSASAWEVPCTPPHRAGRSNGEVFYEPEHLPLTRHAAAVATETADDYPHTLTRDAPPRGSIGTLTRTYRAPQRASPVRSCAAAPSSPPRTQSARRRSVHVARAAEHIADPQRYSGTDGSDIFYDDLAIRRASRGGRAGASVHDRLARSAGSSGTAVHVRDGGDAAPMLSEAVQRIDATMQQWRPPQLAGTRSRQPTPTRHRQDRTATGQSPERAVSRNANLRAAALRRLAEVVSQTKVSPTRGQRF